METRRVVLLRIYAIFGDRTKVEPLKWRIERNHNEMNVTQVLIEQPAEILRRKLERFKNISSHR